MLPVLIFDVQLTFASCKSHVPAQALLSAFLPLLVSHLSFFLLLSVVFFHLKPSFVAFHAQSSPPIHHKTRELIRGNLPRCIYKNLLDQLQTATSVAILIPLLVLTSPPFQFSIAVFSEPLLPLAADSRLFLTD